MFVSKLRTAIAAVLFALLFGGIGAGIALAAQTHMVNARQDLSSALAQLQQATADKGGHRDNAINYTKQALSEVNQGIQFAK
jgi:Flp pilus assembly protein TadG